MWNKHYQQRRAETAKRVKLQLNCLEHFFFAVFKHLVHVFVLIIVLAFVLMFALIQQDPYEQPSQRDLDQRLAQFNSYLDMHP
jgi:heme/copper-type cytochrome/quinol oxidase subunit 3